MAILGQFEHSSPVCMHRTGRPVCLRSHFLKVGFNRITQRTKEPLLLLYFRPKEKEINLLEKLKQCGLSHRQAEVVFLLNKGRTNKKIGKQLFISNYTVENQLRAIYQKRESTTVRNFPAAF